MFSANSSQVSEDRLYVEDVFSTYLYTGNSSTQTITNGIDLAGKGGLVWVKQRNSAQSHRIYDTSRGVSQMIASNTTSAQANTAGFGVTSFSSSGFTLVDDASNYGVNFSGNTYASWTFREAPKFFDVVTYTGNGATSRNISHSLGVTPGFIVIKKTSSTGDWIAYHRSIGTGNKIYLNYTNGSSADADAFATVTSTTFSVSPNTAFNDNGATYVAYLFAHDTTSDGIIQCGSYTGTGSSPGPTINLGWEPQWVMIKNAGATGGWRMVDNMRGMTVGTAYDDKYIYANTSGAESDDRHLTPNATGFQIFGTDPSVNTNGLTYVYIAIRRGPMRTPTSGTSVFSPNTTSTDTATTGFPVDFMMQKTTTIAFSNYAADRLRGATKSVKTNSTDAESTALADWSQSNTGVQSTGIGVGASVIWSFRRAPSFFDEVCYTGNGTSGRTVAHNLGVVPELVIVKARSTTGDWVVLNTQGGSFSFINLTNEFATGGIQFRFGDNTSYVAPTTSTFTLGTNSAVNGSGNTYVAYLFASCPGVSKVFSFTGNGSSQTINCGFSTGARFVMIKRTDSTGDWWVWDTARGLVSGNDPALRLNSTAAETTGIDSIDPDSSGFIVNQDATTNINVNGASYVGIAIS